MKRLSPKKKWGQNFLRNPGAARQIAEAAVGDEKELILEIGPGEGALTHELLASGRRVRVVEIDPDLVRHLRSEFGERIDIVEGDATDVELPDEPFHAVGNLPYNVATPIIRRVISNSNCVRAVFMVQREVAERLSAKPGEKPYGYLSIFTRLFADANRLLTLSPKSFFPRPRVWSAVVALDPVTRELANSKDAVLEVASRSFRMRRKTLANNLIGYRDLTRAEVEQAIEQAGLEPRIRAERLSLEEFDRLTSALGG